MVDNVDQCTATDGDLLRFCLVLHQRMCLPKVAGELTVVIVRFWAHAARRVCLDLVLTTQLQWLDVVWPAEDGESRCQSWRDRQLIVNNRASSFDRQLFVP